MRCGRAPDRGSASIWVLAAAVIVLLVGVLASLRATAVLARHRAESAADLAALAAAGRIGLGADGCAVARSVAGDNGASLARCRLVLDPDGRSGTVDVTITLGVHLPGVGAQRVVATARAGRLPAEPVGPGQVQDRGRVGVARVWHDGRRLVVVATPRRRQWHWSEPRQQGVGRGSVAREQDGQ